MNQSEFFNREDIKALQEIQKRNPHGSIAHRDATKRICDEAIKAGAPQEWAWSEETY